MAELHWDDLCELVSKDDGLPVRDVGEWSEEKLHFWHRYIVTTTNAMIGKPQWRGGLAYVDLFAGPGVCRVRETGKRIPGSPLVAAHSPKPFAKIVCVEHDAELASAARNRLARSPASDVSEVLSGDSNLLVGEIRARLPGEALTLAFIDPEALDIRFETIRELTANKRMDLLILFADAFDIVRNVDEYERSPGNKLDLMLGAGFDWRSRWARLENRSGPNVRVFFAGLYCEQLRSLGYAEFGTKVIESSKGPLYRLVYASKHPRGLDFWNKSVAKDKGGQRDLFGG